MTTLPMPSFLTEVLDGKPISVGKKEYFRARLQSKFHQLVVSEFIRQEDQGLTRAELARRIGKRNEVISRLFGAPGNWTLNTASDLLLGMGAEPELGVHHFEQPIVQVPNEYDSSNYALGSAQVMNPEKSAEKVIEKTMPESDITAIRKLRDPQLISSKVESPYEVGSPQ
jgi:hypothetical protein